MEPLKNDCEKSALVFSRKNGLFEWGDDVLVFDRTQLNYQDRSKEECSAILEACVSFLRYRASKGKAYYHCILMEDNEGSMRVEGIPVCKVSKTEQVGEIE